jgi:hypothetical protein
MGSFSNGTEGESYECRFCDSCVHNHEEWGCPCWSAHILWSYDECNNDDSILHKMIPRDEKHNNLECFCYQKCGDRMDDYVMRAKYDAAMKMK